jgi:Ca2+/H+ antiporter
MKILQKNKIRLDLLMLFISAITQSCIPALLFFTFDQTNFIYQIVLCICVLFLLHYLLAYWLKYKKNYRVIQQEANQKKIQQLKNDLNTPKNTVENLKIITQKIQKLINNQINQNQPSYTKNRNLLIELFLCFLGSVIIGYIFFHAGGESIVKNNPFWVIFTTLGVSFSVSSLKIFLFKRKWK